MDLLKILFITKHSWSSSWADHCTKKNYTFLKLLLQSFYFLIQCLTGHFSVIISQMYRVYPPAQCSQCRETSSSLKCAVSLSRSSWVWRGTSVKQEEADVDLSFNSFSFDYQSSSETEHFFIIIIALGVWLYYDDFHAWKIFS